ncbi:MAG: ACP S-malonyltransferase [Candidatus Omnitrophica bacterium]|nr:ACP S-malonyltransferase [Candidatus Omnitrophota bacterium]
MKTALIFPGQGSQFVGMGQEFYAASAEAKAVFDTAEGVVPGLREVIFNGPAEKLTSTKFCQPAIVAFSLAALKALQAHPGYKNLQPCFAAGLSLGEYAAMAACGTLSVVDIVRLVERRSFFMEEAAKANPGAMAAVLGFDSQALSQICRETGAQVANFNTPDQIVITGEKDKVLRACAILREKGALRVIPLEVSGGFHSTLMRAAADRFALELEPVQFMPPQFPLLGNVDANPVTDPQIIKSNLPQQIYSSVQWVKTIQTIAAAGVTTFIEIGPGTILKGLIRKIDRSFQVHNIQIPADIDTLLNGF